MKKERSTQSKIVLQSILMVLTLSIGFPTIIWSEEYPSRPITAIISTSPGGVTDIALRAVFDDAKKYLKQEILPVNKPGGGHMVALGTVISSPSDGYTLGGTTDAPYIREPNFTTLPFDPFNETIPIALFAKFNNVVFVKSDSPFKTFDDFMSFAKANPGKLTYGIPQVGTMPHLGMEGMTTSKKFKLAVVPHSGEPPVVLAVLGGHIMAGGVALSVCMPQVKAGKIRMLALIEGKERIKDFPDLPTLYEFGFENAFAAPGLLVYGRKGLSEGKVSLLAKVFLKASESDSFNKVAQNNYIYLNNKLATGQPLLDYLRSENKKTGELVKALGLFQKK